MDLLGSYSMPRPSPPTPVVLTDWLSTTPALGSGSRLIRTRTRLRRAECILHPLEGTVEPPSPEIVVDGLPGRKVVGQQAPGAAASQDVEDGVYDLTQGVQPGSSGCVRCGQMGLYVRPLFLGCERSVGYVFLIRARVANHYPTNPFRTVSLRSSRKLASKKVLSKKAADRAAPP